MADYGFRISQPGYDVTTATDNQLVITSKLNSLKMGNNLYGSATITIPAPAGSTYTFTFNHNLGYIPAFDAWYKDEFGVWKSCFMNRNGSPFGNEDGSSIACYNDSNWADINTVNIFFFKVSSFDTTAYTVPLYYIVFVDQIS